jgi:hypothetical protein
MTKTAIATIHMTADNAAFVAELVGQSRREALDAGETEIAERCDRILNSLGFALHMAA